MGVGGFTAPTRAVCAGVVPWTPLSSHQHPLVPVLAPRAVLYLRQSTFREESISLELQEMAGRDYCSRKGYTVVAVETHPASPGARGRAPPCTAS